MILEQTEECRATNGTYDRSRAIWAAHCMCGTQEYDPKFGKCQSGKVVAK